MVDEQFAFLQDVAKLIQYAASLGLKVTGGELYRTVEQQAIYIKTGRSKTMKSKHLDRLAIDLNFFKDGKLTYDVPEVGRYWESLSSKNSAGMFWKSFKDAPHFERRV
jgi:peptidoglycan L-alanyl-D-glutamate endopeptidase CwlK